MDEQEKEKENIFENKNEIDKENKGIQSVNQSMNISLNKYNF